MESLVYSWFCNNYRWDILKNREYPILLSIASFRNHNKTIPIYVFDHSYVDHNWKDYPERFKFNLIKTKIDTTCSNNAFESIFSNIVKCVQENRILIAESDIFWLKDPFPISYNGKIRFAKNIGGVYFFDKNENIEFINKWIEIIRLTLESKINKEVYTNTKSKIFMGENDLDRTRDYLSENYCHLIDYLDYDYNCVLYNLIIKNKNLLSIAKNLHCSQAFCSMINRFKVPLLIKDFNLYNLEKKEINKVYNIFTIQELLNSNDHLIYFLQELGWSINKKDIEELEIITKDLNKSQNVVDLLETIKPYENSINRIVKKRRGLT